MNLKTGWNCSEVIFDLAGKQVRLRHLEELLAAPELWDDQARAAEILKERGALLQALEEWQGKGRQIEDLEVLLSRRGRCRRAGWDRARAARHAAGAA